MPTLMPLDLHAVKLELRKAPRARPCAVLLYSKGCPPCEELYPEFERMAKATDDIDFFAFETLDYQSPLKDLRIVGFPALIFIDRHGKRNTLFGRKWEAIHSAIAALRASTTSATARLVKSSRDGVAGAGSSLSPCSMGRTRRWRRTST